MSSRLQTFTLPDVGEGLTEAEILSWHVAVGDTLTVNQIMVEIETAKAAVELPSPHAGRVHQLLAEPGVTIEVGTPIIVIDTDPDAGPLDGDDSSGGAAGPSAGSGAAPSGGDEASGAGDPAGDAGAKIGEAMADGRVATLVGYIAAESGGARRARRGAAAPAGGPAGPAAEPAGGMSGSAAAPAGGASGPAAGSALARPDRAGAEPSATVTDEADKQGKSTPMAASAAPATAGIQSLATAAAPGPAPLATPPVRKLAKDLGIDLRSVTATRPDGVISRADVEAHASTATSVETAGVERAPAAGARAYDPATRETRVPVKGVRKMTAAAMVSSAFTAPHVTEFLTVDVTPMMKLREKLRGQPEFAEVRLSPLAFAARAVCLAARRTPEANCVWDEDAQEIVYKQYVNLGIAAATPRGLIVPVIRDADQLDLSGLARALGELTATARSGKTPPADMTGGTFTITNVGVFGVDTGTPIINPGESAILALGSIKDAPWVVNGKLKVRKVCQLALSFDHRVIDGQQGSQFLADVGALLADPALAITY